MDCPSEPVLATDEWTSGVMKRLGGSRWPLHGSIELTERCNLSCIHCYVNQPASSREVAARELALPQIRSILDQAADAGCLHLTLTGGEPLLRPDLQEIYLHAKKKGMLVTLFTNATLLKPDLADLLAEYRPQSVEVTVYGHTRETYERVTRVAGSHARCMAGVELLLERRVPLHLKGVLLRANRHELAAMQAYAAEHGIRFRHDGLIWPRLDGGQGPVAERLSPQEMVALDGVSPEEKRAWLAAHESPSGAPPRGEYIYNCGAGQRAFHVGSSGRMSLCVMTHRPFFDLLQGDFAAGWQFLGELRGKKRTQDTPCRMCGAGALCHQCSAWSQAVHGDDETPVDFVCQVGRLRQAAWHSADA